MGLGLGYLARRSQHTASARLSPAAIGTDPVKGTSGSVREDTLYLGGGLGPGLGLGLGLGLRIRVED